MRPNPNPNVRCRPSMRISRRRAASCCSARSPKLFHELLTAAGAPHPAGTSSTGEVRSTGPEVGDRARCPSRHRREADTQRSKRKNNARITI
eukprot:scaffold63438_cov57-Phaeocystis_antarctica.AAC.6